MSTDMACKDCGLEYQDFGLDTVLNNEQWLQVRYGIHRKARINPINFHQEIEIAEDEKVKQMSLW